MTYSETQTELFQADENTRLLSRQWLTEKKLKAIFIAVHGGMAHSGDWVTPALFFKEKGISTLALDLRWHGTYPEYNKNGKVFFHIDGYRQNVEDIYNFYSRIRGKYPGTPVFILSHSYGADIALMFGLMKKETDIKGIIVSSPWLKNKVKVSVGLRFIAGIIALFYPNFAVKTENLIDKLTHDQDIARRHYADETAGLRGTKATVRTGTEMIKMQNWIINNMDKWDTYPLFAVIAGNDHLADPDVSINILNKAPKELLRLSVYKDNFHENFNELNRNEIFNEIYKWIKPLI